MHLISSIHPCIAQQAWIVFIEYILPMTILAPMIILLRFDDFHCFELVTFAMFSIIWNNKLGGQFSLRSIFEVLNNIVVLL